jgi:dihydrofolate synthase/folylpolyglutamate synthase
LSAAWDRYQRACTYINEGLIRTETPQEPNPRTRRQWMEWFLPGLDRPQRSFEAIHIAGTSGKGSVAMMIAEILDAAGIRAGLHISPYLQVATEKLWVDGSYASAAEFVSLVDWIRPAAEACRGPHTPLHGMASVGIFLEHFRRCGVQLGVVEAGVGGRSDLTNVLNTRVAVITAVGLDHVKTLGPTLESIAWHKAGIIKPGCRAVVLAGPAVPAAQSEARGAGAPLRVIEPRDFSGTTDPSGRVLLDFRGERLSLRQAPLAMPGRFQAENAALAVAAVEELGAPYEERVTEQAVRAGLERARLPGRLEVVPRSERNPCQVLLDGAHNPDKLVAMIATLRGLSYRRLHLVYGSLGSRTPDRELRQLASLAATFVVSEPRVYQKSPRPAEEVARAIAGECQVIHLEPSPPDAIARALERADPDDLVVVTGSLYLCGEVRGRWYPADEVLVRRSSWF